MFFQLDCLLQFFFYHLYLINWCYLVYLSIFLTFQIFTLAKLLISSSTGISPLYFSVSLCILNFHLSCLKLFSLRVMITGFITSPVTYIISFKSLWCFRGVLSFRSVIVTTVSAQSNRLTRYLNRFTTPHKRAS